MMHLEELIWKLTGGFTRVPIMRPHPWITVLHVSLWAALVLTLNADSEDSGCTPMIKVHRNTAYETSLGQELVINCTVDFCNKSVPTVTWFQLLNETYKHISVGSSSHIRTEWKEFNHSEGASFLIFQKILSNDSGLYQCRVGNDVSHAINVSVHGGGEHTRKNNTSNTVPKTSNPEALKPMWMYMSSAAGIVGFVTVAIVITVVSMRWCKGKSKKGTQSECQYATIHMVERPLTRGGPPPGPRASPSAPPSRLSAPKDPRPDELTSPRDQVYSKVKGGSKRKRNAVEDGSGVVYAALNHQLPPGAAARPRRSDDCSEYAAIRVA
ncbi:B- and T-lymphocyte attenuator-like isoform X2 [Hippoglossus hippoglossus]|uniref:B- and T-lymphocyte attenuator-like isoform X2 n=1 Tax=Hippoglossus hippoglossus TaxID=8267 RepID=UPI00148C43F4|nr:B- and T-lymphocyte attenuator-like isoform X2 [Hippoglossus hippoglossus]